MDISTRVHPIYLARAAQLRRNALAVAGGQRYIDMALWRAPNESDISWHGTAYGTMSGFFSGKGLVPRAQRTTLVNDCARVSQKINQYIFSKPVQRDGADKNWLTRAGGEKVPLLKFWEDVSSEFTQGGWVWLKVSRSGTAESLAGRTSDTEVRWEHFDALSVPDWSIDKQGRLHWLIISTFYLENENPFVDPVRHDVRELWYMVDGYVRMERYVDGGYESETDLTDLHTLPFVLLGTPTAEPWWFDEVERMQAQTLNLDSLHTDNLVRTVYPQLVLPDGAFRDLQSHLREVVGPDGDSSVMQLTKEISRGVDCAFVETSDESGITRYISPSANDLKALPDEIANKRKILMENSGLHLIANESRQVQSAESKSFDQLDTESTLRNRCKLLQEAEVCMVELSRQVDPSFRVYSPAWPDQFSLPDTDGNISILSAIQGSPDATPELRRIAMRRMLYLLDGMQRIPPEEREKAMKEIEEWEPPDVIDSMADLGGGIDE